ncbi:MAG: MmgE/PrpD family protein [Chloroflexi bacterium]|nr:MmgE/PrpD family protein [Chloroflexota bacterium]
MTDYLDALSDFVADTRYEDLEEGALVAARDVTLDTLGAMVAGSWLSENAAFAKLVSERSSPRVATLLGHGLKAEPMQATLVNATAGVALEVDEGNRFGGGHPAIHCLPGALAVAEEMGASGRRFIESLMVGYEVESRIGGATELRDNVHSHGHWGTIGTAVSVARLKNYTASQVRDVINLAANMSPANTWTPAFEGATVRNLYPGRSGMQGILATHVYECGFTGLDDGPSDVFGTILGQRFSPERVVDGIGTEYRIQQNYFKFYACCRYNHPALDALFSIEWPDGFSSDEIESVEISTPVMLDRMVGDYPDTMLGAKFNVHYAVAAALVRDTADVTAFRVDAISDNRTRDLAFRVNVIVDPAPFSGRRDGTPADAVVRMKDGGVLKGSADIVRGDYGNRAFRSEIIEKFHALNDSILGEAQADKVVETVDRLDSLADVRELTALLGGRSTK